MEKTAYGILILVAVFWLVAMIREMVAIWPDGVIGLVAIVALGMLFIKVLKERLAAAKDDRYSKDVQK